jgi:hypothetical protein
VVLTKRPGEKMSFNTEADRNEHETAATKDDQEENPIYEKPILRKYDQIDQVKPYGPSELEAG